MISQSNDSTDMKTQTFNLTHAADVRRRVAIRAHRRSLLDGGVKMVVLALLTLTLFAECGKSEGNETGKADIDRPTAQSPPAPKIDQIRLPKESNQALEALRQDFEQHPSPRAAISLAGQYSALGKQDLAAKVLNIALSLPQLDAPTAVEIAARLEKMDDTKGRYAALSKARRLAPGMPVVQSELRRASESPAFKRLQAEEDIAAAKAIYEKNVTAKNGITLLETLRNAGLTNDAEKLLVRLQNEPFHDPVDYVFVGGVLCASKKYVESETVVRKALAVETNNVVALLALAEITFARAKDQKAGQSGDTATSSRPPDLSDDVAKQITEQLEAAFQASLALRRTNTSIVDAIAFARSSAHPVFVTMRARPEFVDRLTQKWIPLWEKQEEELDPAYSKLSKAAAILEVAAKLASFQAFGDAVGVDSPSKESRNNKIKEAALLLDAAFSLNRAQMKTNPAVESLLVSACLQRRINQMFKNVEIGSVVFSSLCQTPISKQWCEDFAMFEDNSYFVNPIDADSLALEARISRKSPLAAPHLLQVATSRSFAKSLIRTKKDQPKVPERDPAAVSHIGPDTMIDLGAGVVAALVTTVQGVAEEEELRQHIDRLVKTAFSKGAAPDLFQLTGKESLDEEAAKNLVEHVSRHVLTRIVRQESGFFLILEGSYGVFALLQTTEPFAITIHKDQLNDIQQMNGSEWSGDLSITINGPARWWVGGQWGQWQRMEGLVTYRLSREHSSWEISWKANWGQKVRFHRPSVRQIRDALNKQ
jgi:tetratricopeptide (TPR) repeat protein